ncbi:MAG: hypothetical protein WAO95_02120 [Burkholderiales bacterium]
MPPRLVLLLFLLACAPAHAARPFVTDDARIVDKDGCQVETFVKDQRRFSESEFWFVPACNPWGAELTAGYIRVNSDPAGDTNSAVFQAKTLLKPLETNGAGFALSLGTFAGNKIGPYVNGIGSLSLADDRVVLHGNLGAIRDNVARLSRWTWGLGGEILLLAPRIYGILETYGQRADKPTLHTGLRIWVVPNRVQVDTTVGLQNSDPERRFGTVGLRILW